MKLAKIDAGTKYKKCVVGTIRKQTHHKYMFEFINHEKRNLDKKHVNRKRTEEHKFVQVAIALTRMSNLKWHYVTKTFINTIQLFSLTNKIKNESHCHQTWHMYLIFIECLFDYMALSRVLCSLALVGSTEPIFGCVHEIVSMVDPLVTSHLRTQHMV